MKQIVFDVMSGEAKVSEAIAAAISFANNYPQSHLILVGAQEELEKVKEYPNNIKFKYSTQIIKMDETSPLAFKRKKDSSLSIAINQLVDNNNAEAIVSCANTSAYVTGAFLISKPILKSLRPGLVGLLPSETNKIKVMMDLGAIIDADAKTLESFAIMASIYHSIITNTKSPKVSLLSNGVEAHKGNAVTKEAHKLMSANPKINFIGNEEGQTALTDFSDVIISDGFTGNISLKVFQGATKYVAHNLKQSFSKNIFRKMAAFFALGALKEAKNSMTAIEKAGGTTMLGLNHIVIKAPGSAQQEAMYNSLVLAQKLIDQNIIKQIKDKLA